MHLHDSCEEQARRSFLAALKEKESLELPEEKVAVSFLKEEKEQLLYDCKTTESHEWQAAGMVYVTKSPETATNTVCLQMVWRCGLGEAPQYPHHYFYDYYQESPEEAALQAIDDQHLLDDLDEMAKWHDEQHQ